MKRGTAPLVGGLLLSALSVAATAQAQVFGVIGGANYGEINVSGAEPLNVAFTMKLEPVGGLAVTFRLADAFFLETDALFSVKGSRLDVGGREDRVRLSYLEFPALVRVGQFDAGGLPVQVIGGGYVAWLLDGSYTTGAGTDVNVDDAFTSVDGGWVAGFAIGYRKFHVDARFSGGINNMASNSAFPQGIAGLTATTTVKKYRNRSFSFLATYSF